MKAETEEIKIEELMISTRMILRKQQQAHEDRRFVRQSLYTETLGVNVSAQYIRLSHAPALS